MGGACDGRWGRRETRGTLAIARRNGWQPSGPARANADPIGRVKKWHKHGGKGNELWPVS